MPTDNNEFEVIFGADGSELKKTIGELEADLKAFNRQLRDVKSVDGLTALNKQIEVTAKNIRVLKSANLGQELKGVAPGANAAATALNNVGRVAQDLPFGFIGIQNNLNPLLESFQRLKAETGSTKTALVSLGSSLAGAGGIGLALSAISAAFLIYQNGIAGFNKKTKEATDAFDEFAASLNKGSLTESLKDANKEAAEQISKLQILASAAADVTRSTDERSRAVKELRRELGPYADALTDEAILNGRAADAIDRSTEAIIKNARAAGAAERIKDVTKKQLDIDIERLQILNELTAAQTELAKRTEDANNNALEQSDIGAGQSTAPAAKKSG